MKSQRPALILLGTLLAAPAGAETTSGVNSIPVCYNFGCKTQMQVSLTAQEWLGVAGWFTPPAPSAAAEREQIRQAVGWMEVLIGQHTPTHRDKGMNLSHAEALFPGQLDCIDESKNTTTYLRLFESHGLLRWHRVVDRAYRRAIFDQHWAGQIEETANGTRYVVDSWFEDNGYLPYVQASAQWEDIPYLFTSLRNNAPD